MELRNRETAVLLPGMIPFINNNLRAAAWNERDLFYPMIGIQKAGPVLDRHHETSILRMKQGVKANHETEYSLRSGHSLVSASRCL